LKFTPFFVGFRGIVGMRFKRLTMGDQGITPKSRAPQPAAVVQRLSHANNAPTFPFFPIPPGYRGCALQAVDHGRPGHHAQEQGTHIHNMNMCFQWHVNVLTCVNQQSDAPRVLAPLNHGLAHARQHA
jgi:hypothetical protein